MVFFIEAGAFDGEIFSNTLLLEMNLNWTGLLIEPNPEIFQTLLTKNRKSYAIETCLSTKPIVTEVSFDVAGIGFMVCCCFLLSSTDFEFGYILGLFGGIINGKFKPSDVHQSQL